MARFLNSADLVAAGIDDAIQRAGGLTAAGLPSAFDQTPYRKGRSTSLYEIGCLPGLDVSDNLNAYMQANPRSKVFIPPLSGIGSDRWNFSKDIILTEGVSFEGDGGEDFEGSALIRSATNASIVLWGTQGGIGSAGMIGGNFFRGVTFHGNGMTYPLIDGKFAFHFTFADCSFRFPGNAPNFISRQQCQDYTFINCYVEGGGTADGTIGSFHIDDSTGTNLGHNQNGKFYTLDFETYNGTAIKMFGKGVGPGNSLFKFFDIKVEAPNRSNVPDIDISDTFRTDFLAWRQCVTKGTVGQTKPCVFRATRCSDITFSSAGLLHQTGGATLTALVELTDSINCKFELRPVGNAVVEALGGPSLVVMNNPQGNDITSTLLGSSGNQKLLTADSLGNSKHVQTDLWSTTINVRTIEAVYGSLYRYNPNGTLRAGARARLFGIPGTTYAEGPDASNNWSWWAGTDLTAAPTARLNVAAGEFCGSGGFRHGNGTGPFTPKSYPGNPEGFVVGEVGSVCTNSSATNAAGSRLYYKATGSGNTGWVASPL